MKTSNKLLSIVFIAFFMILSYYDTDICSQVKKANLNDRYINYEAVSQNRFDSIILVGLHNANVEIIKSSTWKVLLNKAQKSEINVSVKNGYLKICPDKTFYQDTRESSVIVFCPSVKVVKASTYVSSHSEYYFYNDKSVKLIGFVQPSLKVELDNYTTVALTQTHLDTLIANIGVGEGLSQSQFVVTDCQIEKHGKINVGGKSKFTILNSQVENLKYTLANSSRVEADSNFMDELLSKR